MQTEFKNLVCTNLLFVELQPNLVLLKWKIKTRFSLCIVLGLHYFASPSRLHLDNAKIKTRFSLCIVLGLHYFCTCYESDINHTSRV